MEIFRLKESEPELRTSPFIAYNTIMEVLMKSVQKAKHTLGFAESKNLKCVKFFLTFFRVCLQVSNGLNFCRQKLPRDLYCLLHDDGIRIRRYTQDSYGCDRCRITANRLQFGKVESWLVG